MQAQKEAGAAGMGTEEAATAAEEDRLQALQEAAEKQAALSTCGCLLLRSLRRALDLAQLCCKAMSDAAERLACAPHSGGQVTHPPSTPASQLEQEPRKISLTNGGVSRSNEQIVSILDEEPFEVKACCGWQRVISVY